MIRRLGLLLLAACNGLWKAEQGLEVRAPATRNGVPRYLFAGQVSAGPGRLVERAVRRHPS